MKNIFKIFVLIFAIATSYAAQASSINWTPLPQACLPERAVKWDERFSNTDQQAACHCPPKSYCPTTYEEYADNSKAKMPMGFVMRCCEPVAAPERCPNGELKVAGKACEEPKVSECPTKYYPNLEEAGMVNASHYYSRWYVSSDNEYHRFIIMANWPGVEVDALRSLFNWSLRLSALNNWVHGDQLCKSHAGDVVCANKELSRLSGMDYNHTDFDGLIKRFQAANLTWFGTYPVPKEKLPDNFVSEAVLSKYSTQKLSYVQVAANGVGTQVRRINGLNYVQSQHILLEQPNIGLLNAHPEFVEVCRGVAGEYVTIEYHDQVVDGETLSCPYLQCRYVYDSNGESCLAADTKITLADGAKKKIADLKVGDLVLGDDGKPSKVKAVNKYQEDLRVLYGINGGKAMITGDHPIKTNNGWKVITDEAAKLYAVELGFAKVPLKIGDKIITLEGEIEVKSIERHPSFEPIDTYNLKVEGNNSFTANDMIVKGFDKMEIKY